VTLSSGFPSFITTPKFDLLVVRDVPAGATVKATCRTKRGRRCAGTRDFTRRNARGEVKLRGFLGRRFPAGSVIEVRVTKPGAIGAVKQIKIRRGKRPQPITRCLPPGARKPVRC
jgi:hypothetical protein